MIWIDWNKCYNECDLNLLIDDIVRWLKKCVLHLLVKWGSNGWMSDQHVIQNVIVIGMIWK